MHWWPCNHWLGVLWMVHQNMFTLEESGALLGQYTQASLFPPANAIGGYDHFADLEAWPSTSRVTSAMATALSAKADFLHQTMLTGSFEVRVRHARVGVLLVGSHPPMRYGS